MPLLSLYLPTNLTWLNLGSLIESRSVACEQAFQLWQAKGTARGTWSPALSLPLSSPFADLLTLTVWDAMSRSHGFASKSHGEPENLEIAKKFRKV